MPTEHIKKSVEAAIDYLGKHPDEARYTDTWAKATLEQGLHFRIVDANANTVFSDMPASVGGGGAAPSPAWLMRAGLASCAATLIAIRAAQQGLQLTQLEVLVDSESDDYGILGMDAAVPAGPLSAKVRCASRPQERAKLGCARWLSGAWSTARWRMPSCGRFP
ncbi:MAG TPA: OsmC family protein [Anaerolineales bacterium]|nr:OsmC family protein [Anaerolineales bacterium]